MPIERELTLKVLPPEVKVDESNLPHEALEVAEADDIIEMADPYRDRESLTHGIGTKATPKPQPHLPAAPFIPGNLIDSAIRAKVKDIASQVDILSNQIRQIMLVESDVAMRVQRGNETLSLIVGEKSFFDVLSFFLFATQINYSTRLTVSYEKAGVTLLEEKRTSGDLYSQFNLSSVVSNLRKKIAIWRAVKHQLDNLKAESNSIRSATSSAEDVLNALGKAQGIMGGFAQVYNTEVFTEIENLLTEVNRRTCEGDKEYIIVT